MIARTFLILAVLAAPFGARAADDLVLMDKVVAQVDESIVTMSEVEDRAASFRQVWTTKADPKEREDTRLTVMRGILEDLVADLLLRGEIKRAGVVVEAGEIDRAVERVREQNRMPDLAALKRALAAEGYDWEDYRNRIRDEIARWRFIGQVLGGRVRVREEDVDNYHRRESGRTERMFKNRVAHILIKLAPDAEGDALIEAAKRAEDVLARARTPGVDFAALAAEFSDAPSGAQGGELGPRNPGELHPAFEAELPKLKIGEVCPKVVRTHQGLHVFRLIDRERIEAKLLDDQERARIRETLQEQESQKQLRLYLDRVRAKSHIVIFPPFDTVAVPNRPEPAP